MADRFLNSPPPPKPLRYSPPFTSIEFNWLDISRDQLPIVTELVHLPDAVKDYPVKVMHLTFHDHNVDAKTIRMMVKTMLIHHYRLAKLEEEGKLPDQGE